MKLFHRELYLSKLRGFYDDAGMIKVLTGIRRCGKSCILQSVIEELKEQGVEESRLVDINLDKRAFRKIKTPDQLEQLIESLAPADDLRLKYLFIDEIENVKGFEEIINGFREDGDWSIFITGSNSYLLSGQLVTKLTATSYSTSRSVFTLSFAEYLGMKQMYGMEVEANLAVEFGNYLAEGGFPKAIEYPNAAVARIAYTTGVIQDGRARPHQAQQQDKAPPAYAIVRTWIVRREQLLGAPTSVKNILDRFPTGGGYSDQAADPQPLPPNPR